MRPFILTRTYEFSKIIPASKEELLRVLHDPVQFIHLSPLVKSHEQDPKDPTWYTVTERLPLLGGLLETQTTFRCKSVNNDTGRQSEVFAGSGTHMDCYAVVEEVKGDPNSTKFTEVVTLKGFILLMPYIISTMKHAHYGILDVLTAKFTA